MFACPSTCIFFALLYLPLAVFPALPGNSQLASCFTQLSVSGFKGPVALTCLVVWVPILKLAVPVGQLLVRATHKWLLASSTFPTSSNQHGCASNSEYVTLAILVLCAYRCKARQLCRDPLQSCSVRSTRASARRAHPRRRNGLLGACELAYANAAWVRHCQVYRSPRRLILAGFPPATSDSWSWQRKACV